jgi:two-component system chemotaxis response regulator CheB
MLQSVSPPVPQARSQGTRVSKPVRVLVVDDSVVMRQLISRVLSDQPHLEVVGVARNGLDALAKTSQLKPDLITLDVEMPELDGLGALRRIRQEHPNTRVIMCSSLTARGAKTTIDALMLGADEYVTKQRSGEMTQSAYDVLRTDLLEKINILFPSTASQDSSRRTTGITGAQGPAAANGPVPRLVSASRPAPKVLVIGVSTGGPSALAELLPMFPADFSLPIMIVQHMPPTFTASLAERLDKLSAIRVLEATAGMTPTAGTALIAPGDYHLRVVRRGLNITTALDQGERENFCRPAVDVLFRSVAEVYSGAAIATILTGMGQDGLLGVRQLRNLGAIVFAQNKDTSVVWGMPGAIATANLADAVLPLKEIYNSIERQL